MMTRKPLLFDWIALAGAGVAGLLTGAGNDELSFAERVALGVTIGLTTVVVLHLAVRLLGGRRRGP